MDNALKEQVEASEEKEKLILPRIDSAAKQKSNKVGFIDEDAKSNAATQAAGVPAPPSKLNK